MFFQTRKPRHKPPPLPPLPLDIGINELGGKLEDPKDTWLWRLYWRFRGVDFVDY
jgi:hypothetical protein